LLAGRVCVDRDDIESAHAVDELFPLGEKHGGCANEFSLLVNINRQAGLREIVVRAKTHLNEYEAIPVLHYQVDFTKAGAEILADRGQALAQKILESLVLGI
jgi:hypothetical protein